MKRADFGYLIGLILCAAAMIVFGIPGLLPFADQTAGSILSETALRASGSLFLILLMLWKRFGVLAPKWRGSDLIWCLPCLAVALANFPFSALSSGAARVDRTDLLFPFVLKCSSVALLEELFFRALLLPILAERIQKNRHKLLFSVLIGSAVFALSHLLNLFFGAGVGATLLQVGYTFLLGCMFSVVYFKTENVWLCVLLHTIFDIGGTLIAELGSGSPWDAVFWVLTAAAGVLCAIHILFSLKKLSESE